jgi:NADH-quinone oxidoreductase subunit G
MCKVEVIQSGRKRIDISCNVPVQDGLEILTDTTPVLKARQMTLEFLLANHPLDCPICDDAGECELQNYYLDHGRHDSRMREVKYKKRKAYDAGGSIVLDSERCVLCSRCVRFLEEITRTRELGIFGMGHSEELMVRPGATVDNNYAGNVVDLCPVGALTDKDFRFKRRVWFLRSAASICQLCSRGCNLRIDYDINPYHEHKRNFNMRKYRTQPTRYARIQRLKPRINVEVNGHWICDYGRYGYRSTDADDRLLHALTREGDDLRQIEVSEALKQIGSGITTALGKGQEKVAIVVSPILTNEELFAVHRLFCNRLNLANIDHRLPVYSEWYGDDLLRTPDPFPNRTGCEWIGLEPGVKGIGVGGLEEAVLGGRIDTLLSILADPRNFLSSAALNKLKRRYIILRQMPEDLKNFTDVAIPAAAWGEYEGTFTNFQGRLQKLEQAFEPLGDARPVWRLMTDLSSWLKKPLNWKTFHDVFSAMTHNVHLFAKLNWEEIGAEGFMTNRLPVGEVA